MPNKSGRRLGRIALAFMIALAVALFIALPAAVVLNYISTSQSSFIADAMLELLVFGLLPFAWMLMRGKSAGFALKSLGLASQKRPLTFSGAIMLIAIGAGIFGVVLGLELAIAAVGAVTNTQINTNVNAVFQGAPLWFLVFAAVGGPVCEELFFRGFLINGIGNTIRKSQGLVLSIFGSVNSVTIFLVLNSFYSAMVGAEAVASLLIGFLIEYILLRPARPAAGKPITASIINSATVFGILHAGYGSTFSIEIIAAMAFGLIAGYVFTRTRSLYPSILAHIAVNSIAVVSLLVLTHW